MITPEDLKRIKGKVLAYKSDYPTGEYINVWSEFLTDDLPRLVEALEEERRKSAAYRAELERIIETAEWLVSHAEQIEVGTKGALAMIDEGDYSTFEEEKNNE